MVMVMTPRALRPLSGLPVCLQGADQEAPEQEFFADPGGAIQPEQSRGSSTSAQV